MGRGARREGEFGGGHEDVEHDEGLRAVDEKWFQEEKKVVPASFRGKLVDTY